MTTIEILILSPFVIAAIIYIGYVWGYVDAKKDQLKMEKFTDELRKSQKNQQP